MLGPVLLGLIYVKHASLKILPCLELPPIAVVNQSEMLRIGSLYYGASVLLLVVFGVYQLFYADPEAPVFRKLQRSSF